MRPRSHWWTLATIAVAACGEGPEITAQFTAMTQNVYVGADIEQVLLASTPQEFLAAVDSQFKVVVATNFPERAKALAAAITDAEPDIVGLQEISLIRVQSPGDQINGGTELATDTLYDYLGSLLAELAALGANYTVAAKVQNFDLEVTRGNDTFDDVRLTDFDVILARSDIGTSAAATGNYATALTVPVATGTLVTITRGWVGVDAVIDGVTYRVVNTHLESATSGARIAQAQELMSNLEAATRPIILLGDLNSDAISGTDPTYGAVLNAGYQDLWALDASAGSGLSCCQNAELSNTTSILATRIDLVLTRNISVASATGLVVGNDPADRTPSGLWPSDHAGVVMSAVVTVLAN